MRGFDMAEGRDDVEGGRRRRRRQRLSRAERARGGIAWALRADAPRRLVIDDGGGRLADAHDSSKSTPRAGLLLNCHHVVRSLPSPSSAFFSSIASPPPPQDRSQPPLVPPFPLAVRTPLGLRDAWALRCADPVHRAHFRLLPLQDTRAGDLPRSQLPQPLQCRVEAVNLVPGISYLLCFIILVSYSRLSKLPASPLSCAASHWVDMPTWDELVSFVLSFRYA